MPEGPEPELGEGRLTPSPGSGASLLRASPSPRRVPRPALQTTPSGRPRRAPAPAERQLGPRAITPRRTASAAPVRPSSSTFTGFTRRSTGRRSINSAGYGPRAGHAARGGG